MSNIDLSRVPSYYHRYIERASMDDLPAALQKHFNNINPLLESLPQEKWNYRYAEGKWSIKEMVQHLIDAERIFCYRALCFARKDKTPLPGFDENEYALNSNADQRKPVDLVKELAMVNLSTIQLFNSFDESQLDQDGVANGKSVYVKAIAYIIIGHVLHHKAVLEERYLP